MDRLRSEEPQAIVEKINDLISIYEEDRRSSSDPEQLRTLPVNATLKSTISVLNDIVAYLKGDI